MSDKDRNVRQFLNAVDQASGYQAVAPVNSKRPDDVLRVFTRVWLTPFGIPHETLADNGSEFEAEFGENVKHLDLQ